MHLREGVQQLERDARRAQLELRVLAMDGEERLAQAGERADGRRLVFDEGPSSTVRGELAPQEDRIGFREARLGEHGPDGRVPVELAGHRQPLGALPDQLGGPPAAGEQGQRVDQDGLPARLARDDRQALSGSSSGLDDGEVLDPQPAQHEGKFTVVSRQLSARN